MSYHGREEILMMIGGFPFAQGFASPIHGKCGGFREFLVPVVMNQCCGAQGKGRRGVLIFSLFIRIDNGALFILKAEDAVRYSPMPGFKIDPEFRRFC